MIHPTAVVDPGACVHPAAIIGPHCMIGERVFIGEGTELGNGVVVTGPTQIGRFNKIAPFAVLGGAPQDVRFLDDRSSSLEIGDRNHIREYATINRGTGNGSGVTVIGDGCLIMAMVHIAHDCRVSDSAIITNCTQLAGHVTIGAHARLAGFCGVAPFVRVGAYSYVTGQTGVTLDVPPYTIARDSPASIAGVNILGLRKKGFDEPSIRELMSAVRIWSESGRELNARLAEIRDSCGQSREVGEFIRFLADETYTGVAPPQARRARRAVMHAPVDGPGDLHEYLSEYLLTKSK
jgi:UDP-N-acetylglucosamine acyltransferase